MPDKTVTSLDDVKKTLAHVVSAIGAKTDAELNMLGPYGVNLRCAKNVGQQMLDRVEGTCTCGPFRLRNKRGREGCSCE